MTEQVFSLLANNLENRLLGAKLLSGDILNHLVSLQALKGSSPSWSLQLEGIATSADTVESVHTQYTIQVEPRALMKKNTAVQHVHSTMLLTMVNQRLMGKHESRDVCFKRA